MRDEELNRLLVKTEIYKRDAETYKKEAEAARIEAESALMDSRKIKFKDTVYVVFLILDILAILFILMAEVSST